MLAEDAVHAYMVQPRVTYLPEQDDTVSAQRVARERAVMMDNLAIAQEKRKLAADARLAQRRHTDMTYVSSAAHSQSYRVPPQAPRYPLAPPHRACRLSLRTGTEAAALGATTDLSP